MRAVLRRCAWLVTCVSLQAAAADDLLKLAVYDLKVVNAPPQLAVAAQARIADALGKQGYFKVVTAEALRSLLALERQKQLLGCSEAESSCMAEMADALGVQYLVTGAVTAVGAKGKQTYSLDVTLLDVAKARRESSEVMSGASEGELLGQLPAAMVRLTEKIGVAYSGQLDLKVSERGAVVKIDGIAKGSTPLGVSLPVPAGLHRLSVEKEGFISFDDELKVKPKQQLQVDVTLVPSADFARAATSKATGMRVGAVATTVLTAAAAGVFIFAKLRVQQLAGSPTVEADTFEWHKQRLVDGIELENGVDHRLRAESLKGQIQTMLLVSWVALGAGAATAITATVLWVIGDSPGRYRKFLETNPVAFVPTPNGWAVNLSYSF